MSVPLEVESTLTDRYQTTVPETVRRALRLNKRDKLRYKIRPDGEVVLSRAEAVEENDPVLSKFLHFLASDIECHPQSLKVLDAGLAQRVQALTHGIKIDLDAPLSADNE